MMAPVEDGREEGDLFAEINVTPFVDVMLVLLVVFMVAAPLLVKGIPLELPRTGGQALGKPAAPVILSVARDRTLFVQDRKVAPAELEGALSALRDGRPDPVVYLRADRGVPYGEVADVIARLSAGGFSHVSLLTRPEPTP